MVFVFFSLQGKPAARKRCRLGNCPALILGSDSTEKPATSSDLSYVKGENKDNTIVHPKYS